MKKARLLLLIPIIGAAFYMRALASWRPKKVLNAPGKIWHLAFSSDGKTLLVGHGSPHPEVGSIAGMIFQEPATITVALDVQKGFQPLWAHKDTRSFTNLQFFAHDSQILKAGFSLQILDAHTGKVRKDYGQLAGSATISPNGKWLAYNHLDVAHWRQRDGRIYLNPAIAAQQGKNIRAEKIIGQQSDTVNAFGFSPDGKTFVVALGDQSGNHLDFYETSTWKRTHSYPDSRREPSDSTSFLLPPPIQWSRDGGFLLPLSNRDGNRIWRLNADKKRVFSSLPISQGDQPPQLQNDGSVLTFDQLTGDRDGRVIRHQTPALKTGTQLLHLSDEPISAAILSPDGSYLIAGTDWGNVYTRRVK